MKKTFYAIMILAVVFFSTAAMAQEQVPHDDFVDFSEDFDGGVAGGEEGDYPVIVSPMVVDKATGAMIVEELLLVQIIGGGVAVLTYAMNGEFHEEEVLWSEVKILTPDKQECTVPDLQYVECPGLDEWNKTVKEILQ